MAIARWENIYPTFLCDEACCSLYLYRDLWTIATLARALILICFYKKAALEMKERIFELNDETEMNEFTDQIVNEIDEYIIEIKRRVK